MSLNPLLRGLAAGDRNGGPIRMALLLYQSLKQNEGFVAQDVLAAYRSWFHSGAYDTGETLVRSFLLMDEGLSCAQAVRRSYELSPGDGIAPAHRAAPMALFLSGAALDTALYQEAKLTHFSELSAQVSVAVGRICSALLRGHSLQDAVEEAKCDLDPRVCLPPRPIERCSRGGYAPEVLCSALSFLFLYPSFTEALVAALRFAGAANYCPVLVGSIGGCLYGAVPAALLQHPQAPSVFSA